MANVNPNNIMATYSAILMTGEEDVDIIKAQHESVKRYVADDATKPVSTPWKTLIGGWIQTGSRAYNVLRRPDTEEVDKYFEELIRRQKKESTDFDSSMRDYSISLCTPQSFDVHYKNAYEFHSKFHDDKIAGTLILKYETILSFGETLNDPLFSTANGLALKETIKENQRNKMWELIKAAKKLYVEEACRRDLQALVAGDPSLFKLLKTGQPITGTAGELAAWFQTSILDDYDGKRHDISLRTNPGIINPLTPCVVAAKVANNTNINNNSGNRQPQQQPKFAKGNKRTHAASYTNSPQQTQHQPPQQPSNKKPKVVGSHKQLGTKFCGYCKHNLKNSISYSFHDASDCFRNPKSLKYDAVKAAILPKK